MSKEFSNKNTSKLVIIGLGFMIIGLVFVIIGLGAMLISVPIGTVGILIGSASIVLGGVVFFRFRSLGSDTTVICHDHGFTVKVVNKSKGNSIQDYTWEEITETKYYVKWGGMDSSDTRYFLVNTEKGTAFNLEEMRGFNELISILNQKTPHLPYIWEKQRGRSGNYSS